MLPRLADNAVGFFNGVDATTGRWLVHRDATTTARELGSASGRSVGQLRWLKQVCDLRQDEVLGLPVDAQPANLAEAGWAVVLHANEEASVLEALELLIEHRREQAGSRLTKVLKWQEGEGFRDWLVRYDAEPGSVLPHRIPYYLLLVGPPTRIPFRVEQLLSVEYAVGRVDLPTAADYARYAASVVSYEQAKAPPGRRTAVFFSTRHEGDGATQLTCDRLMRPLAFGGPDPESGGQRPGVAESCGFATQALLEDDATKVRLLEILRHAEPAFLFTASHGLWWPKGHADQRSSQGALLCQQWLPGDDVVAANFLAAGDLAEASVHGMVAFHFACYGAGTPRNDHFPHSDRPPRVLTDEPFTAALPAALLAHPQGGALAVIGHLERAWGYSVLGASGSPQRLPFENTLRQLLRGVPVGHCLRDFRTRYAVLSVMVDRLEEQVAFGAEIDEQELQSLRAERNDARNYLVLGDPAARIRADRIRP